MKQESSNNSIVPLSYPYIFSSCFVSKKNKRDSMDSVQFFEECPLIFITESTRIFAFFVGFFFLSLSKYLSLLWWSGLCVSEWLQHDESGDLC